MPHHAPEFYMGRYNIFNTINPIGAKFEMYSHRELYYKEVEADCFCLKLMNLLKRLKSLMVNLKYTVLLNESAHRKTKTAHL